MMSHGSDMPLYGTRSTHVGSDGGGGAGDGARFYWPRGGRPVPLGALVLALAAGACTGVAPVDTPAPEEVRVGLRLPAIPARTGKLELSLVHPAPNARIGRVDSTFIFGSTGTGEATLSISGHQVEVEPNGAFLAFLPVPADGRYELVATRGQETVRLERTVRVPPGPATVPIGSAQIVTGSARPRGAWAVQPGERVPVSFQGTPGGTARLVLPDGRRIPLVEEVPAVRPAGTIGQGAEVRPSVYSGYFSAEPLGNRAGSEKRLSLRTRSTSRPVGRATLELVLGSDTSRTQLPLDLALLDPDRPAVAEGAAPAAPEGNGIVVGRPGPGYTYAYFWPNGTRFALTGERNGEYRAQLAPGLDAWIATDRLRLLPAGTPPPRGAAGSARLHPSEGYVDLRVNLTDRLPFQVTEGDRSLELTVFGAHSNTNWLFYGPSDPLIQSVEWEQRPGGIYTIRVALDSAPWGYQTRWGANGDLVLRVRRPPAIDRDQPLRGLLIAVDAGHPPGGATGPTGFTEAEANLQIALRLQPLLESAGARVLMTRTDMEPLSLNERIEMAQRADADLLISIHNNAFPDGINPFENNGTSVYFNHPQSRALAYSIQQSLLREIGMRDIGIGRADLALVRPTWFPAVLTETMYLMIPIQEAGLRDPTVQERIARAHLRGIEAFLRGYDQAR